MDMNDILELKNIDKKTVGLKQSVAALKEKNVSVLYLANDIDKKVYKQIKSVVGEDVEIISVQSREQLGESCGIDVSAACVAILKN